MKASQHHHQKHQHSEKPYLELAVMTLIKAKKNKGMMKASNY